MSQYDVTIIGAGFASMTLAYQLIQNIDTIKVAIINDKDFPVPDVAYKVGESLNEVGGLYLSHVLKLHDYMQENHYKKMGMRFFHESEDSFCEMGIDCFPLNDSFHFERGKFENDFYNSLKDRVDFFNKCKFIDFHNDKKDKNVLFLDPDGTEQTLKTTWIIDASGMKKVLSKKFNITRKLPISHSSVWVRFAGFVNVNDIYVDEGGTPFSNVSRERSSVHVEGLGYWIWILPLSEKTTSLGIVFDENIYSFDDLSSEEKMMSWLDEHEKLLAAYLRKQQYATLDFKKLRKFATLSDCASSTDRWALTGDAYGFWDPYYSNGFDLIGLQNTLLTQIIAADLNGADISRKVDNNNKFMSYAMEMQEHSFIDMYTLSDNWYYLTVKYCIDAIAYFGTLCLIMRNINFPNDDLMEEINNIFKEIVDVFKKIVAFLRSDNFNKPGYTAPQHLVLRPTLYSDVNLRINTPNGDPTEFIKVLKKNLNLIKYQYYYLLEQHDLIKLLSSSIYDKISEDTDIDSYADNPLSLLQER